MEDGRNRNKFTYSYSAPTGEERRIIEDIRRQYLVDEEGETALDRLRRLDRRVKRPPFTLAVIMGVIGVLIIGLGLTVCLEWGRYVLGTVIAALGCVPAATAYPAYRLYLRVNKRRYAERIIKLSDELLKENDDEQRL